MQINITINEKNYEIEGNWTILQACEKIGLYIPRFCYNETLSIAGNCRMCLVEIEKTPKLMPACAIQTINGMKIKTRTSLVKKTRESILEFLLINHPLDCPICDQGGECDLQDQAMIYGSDRGRFHEYKRAVQDRNAGPLIKTIMTRCIHCTRCIRFATEIAGIGTYGTTGRGKGMEVGTYIGKIFDSELSGNVIDLCPVGALTSKPYAFKVRPWELKSIETIDILDSVGTNIRVDIRGSEIMRILPRTNGVIKEQWISDKTRFAHDGLRNQRIKYPMIKKGKGYVTISWKEVIEYIGNRFIETKEERISIIIGQFIDLETTKIIKKRANEKGIDKIYLQEQKNYWENIDLRENYLLDLNERGYETILIGTNPRREATTINIRLKRNVGGGMRTIGNPMNLTYENKQIGKGIDTICSVALGKDLLTKELIKIQNPIIIMGTNIIQRKDGKTIEDMLSDALKIRKGIDGRESYQDRNYHTCVGLHLFKGKKIGNDHMERIAVNILHKYANTPCSLEEGLGNYRKIWKEEKEKNEIIYSIGADIEHNRGIFEIYQGHHGNKNAKEADVILPSSIYIEKKGTYINMEGLVQESSRILEKEKDMATYSDENIINMVIRKKEESNRNRYYKDKGTTYIINKDFEKEMLQAAIKKIMVKDLGITIWDDAERKERPMILERLTREIKPRELRSKMTGRKFNMEINLKKELSCSLGERYRRLYKENFYTLEDNYYLSDVITRASITMARCFASDRIKNNNFQI